MLKRSFIVIFVLALCSLNAFTLSAADKSVPAVKDPATASAAAEKVPVVQNSPAAVVPDKLPVTPALPPNDASAALRSSMENIQSALKTGDKTKAGDLLKGLVIADHEKWFEKTFGADRSKVLAEEYAKFYMDMLQEGLAFFESTVKDEQFTINVIKIENAGDSNATGAQKDAMKAAKVPLTLYTVEFLKAGKDKGKKLWSFVIIDGAAKLAGKMKKVK